MAGRWIGAAEVAELTGYHLDTVREALRAGELKGVQRVKGGTWKTRQDWIDDWMGLEVAA